MCADLVDSSEWRDVHSLSSDSSGTANTSGVLAGTGVDDGVHHHLERVLSGQQVDDLEAVLDNPDSQQLLAVVPSVHHQAKQITDKYLVDKIGDNEC